MTTPNPESTAQVTQTDILMFEARFCGKNICSKSPVTGGLHVFRVVILRGFGTGVRCEFCGAGAYYNA